MINIDSRASTPIYEQIIDAIKEDIIKGILEPGYRLPSVRELASTITANPNTISRAYMELERMKVIETIRGKGTFVSRDYQPKLEEERMEKLKDNLKKIIVEAYYLGIDKNYLMDMVNECYENVNGKTEKNKGGDLT